MAGAEIVGHLLGLHALVAGHLEVKATAGSGDAMVGRAPVGHHKSLISPFVAQYIFQQPWRFGGPDTVDKIIACHQGSGLGILHSSLERREINLVHGALVHVVAYVVAIVVGIIGEEMLHCSHDTFRLHTLDVAYSCTGGKIGVLAHVLEITAAHRGTVYVHSRAEENIDTTGTGVASERLAIALGQILVPCGGEHYRCRICCRRAMCSQTLRTIGHLHGADAETWYGPGVHPVLAVYVIEFFFGRHLRQKFTSLTVDFGCQPFLG